MIFNFMFIFLSLHFLKNKHNLNKLYGANQSINYLNGLITIRFYFELKDMISNSNINNFFPKI